MKRLLLIAYIVIISNLLSACGVMNIINNPCTENKADGSRICSFEDGSQNLTTRTIERDHKMFVSTCSNGYCTEFKEINAPKEKPVEN